jgi:hypothetical protein
MTGLAGQREAIGTGGIPVPPPLPRRASTPVVVADPITSAMDAASERFFAEGMRQEADGEYLESPPSYRGSLDRIARSYRPPLMLLGTVLLLATVAGWWIGLRPSQHLLPSSIWRTAVSLLGGSRP